MRLRIPCQPRMLPESRLLEPRRISQPEVRTMELEAQNGPNFLDVEMEYAAQEDQPLLVGKSTMTFRDVRS